MSLREQRTPDAIEHEIENTRSRIEHRLEVLSHDISPGNLISRALGTNQHSLPDAVNSVFNVVRANPVAACLTFAGLAGLAIGGTRDATGAAGATIQRGSVSSHPDPAKRVGESAAALKERVTGAAESVQETAARVAGKVSGSVSATTQAVSDAAAGASQYARDTAAAVSETTSNTIAQVEAARDAVTEQLKSAPVRARAVGDHGVAWVRENPVPAGLIALAIGAAAASIVTARRAETPQSRLTAGRKLYDAAKNEEPAPASRQTRSLVDAPAAHGLGPTSDRGLPSANPPAAGDRPTDDSTLAPQKTSRNGTSSVASKQPEEARYRPAGSSAGNKAGAVATESPKPTR